MCVPAALTQPALHGAQDYTLKASAAPAAGDKSATFARARVDLARYAAAGGAGDAYVVDVPMALSRAAAAAAAPEAPPPLLRLTVQATWLTRAEDEDAVSDVSELSECALAPAPANQLLGRVRPCADTRISRQWARVTWRRRRKRASKT